MSVGPVVVQANYFQFSSGQTIDNVRVESRMVLWCLSGSGNVYVGPHQHHFSRGNLLILPFPHSVRYVADAKKPFLVAGIHLLPEHPQDTPIPRKAKHQNENVEKVAVHLKDIFAGNLDDFSTLKALLTYIVESCEADHLSAATARALGRILSDELKRVTERSPKTPAHHPRQIVMIQAYIRSHLASKISVGDLATTADCSIPSVYRHFQQYLGKSPGNYIAELRMERVAELLSTTSLRVNEAGAMVGIDNPYYLSRLFRQVMGKSPTEYRQHNSLFPG